jgi:hypothetical protein
MPGTVESVQIMAPRLGAGGEAVGRAKDDLPPRPLADGDLLWVLRGGQGSDMVGLRLVLQGPQLPECIAQETRTTVLGSLVGRNKENLKTYPQPDGTRATHTVWVPGNYDAEALIETTAVNVPAKVTVRTVNVDGCDQLGVCPCARALDCTCDTGLSDAGRGLYDALERCLVEACDGGLSPSPGGCERSARADAGRCGSTEQACAADTF